MSSRAPDFAMFVREALEARLAQVHTCMPARVVAVDADAQTVDVEPTIKSRVRTVDGETIVDTHPVIPAVPYACPRAGSAFLHLPVAVGDFVVLVFGERSLDRWRALGGVQDPQDFRMHDLSDAIAMPANATPDASALPPQAWGNVVLGFAGGSTVHVKPGVSGAVALGSENPSDSAARASRVADELGAIKDALLAYAAAMVPTTQPASGAANTALIAALGTFPGDVASSKVKIDP